MKIEYAEYIEHMVYKDETFDIMMVEQGDLFDPWSLGLLPWDKKPEELDVSGNYRVEDFALYLESLEAYGLAGDLEQKEDELHLPLSYSGSVLLARELLDAYAEYKPLYGHRVLLELIFDCGCLTTAVDHSRAMYRVRRNLETGLRDMSNPKDARCILSFIDGLFIGKYKESLRARYIHGMKCKLQGLWKRMRKGRDA